MKFRSTLVLLLLVLGTAVFIVFFERRAETTEQRLRLARQALRIVPERITHLAIRGSNYVASCRNVRGVWMMEEPVAAYANEGEIERVLQLLAALPRGEVITQAQRERSGLSLEDYGLADPATEITFREDDRLRTLYLGGYAPIGHALYIMESNRTEIVATDGQLADRLPSGPSDFRSRRLIHVPPLRVRRVDVRRPAGFLQLVRTDEEGWRIQQPIEARADARRVNELLSLFCRVEAQRFVADGVVDPSPYGLAEPEIEIALFTERDANPLVVRFGDTLEDNPELVYASTSDSDSVYAVGRHTLLEAAVQPNILRDRVLLRMEPSRIGVVTIRQGEQVIELRKDDAGSWSMTRPRARDAEDALVWELVNAWARVEITSFVTDVDTNATTYGFEPPLFELTFAPSPVAPGPPGAAGADPGSEAEDTPAYVARVLVSRGDDERLWVRLDEGPSVYEVPAEVLGLVRMDPLVYYDRKVLALLPGDIRGITIERAHDTQTVVRTEGGSFSCTAPGATMVEAVAANILAEVQSVRALLHVEENPEQLEAYGLNPPQAVVSFSLSGDAGISKTLLFGSEVKGGGVHAMIRGQDLVSVLPLEVRDRLLSDLCLPPRIQENGVEDAGRTIP